MAGKASARRFRIRAAQAICAVILLALGWLLLRGPGSAPGTSPAARTLTPAPESAALPEPDPPAPVAPRPSPAVCETEPRTFRHGIRSWSRDLQLPAVGRFVEEAHYVTREDFFGDETYPSDKDHRIELHLRRTLRLYRQHDPDITYEKLFPSWFARVWTPSEGGNIGQGSVGASQLRELAPEQEMWLVTMQWLTGERPPPGTRMLVRSGDRKVVVVAGYETGPEQEKFLGGVAPEVHRWLGTHNGSRLEISYLSDQAFPAGPTDCEIRRAPTEVGQR